MDGNNKYRGFIGRARWDCHMVGFRLLAGILLLSWGLALAVHGFGLTDMPIGRLIDLWWPFPVALWAVIGLVQQLRRGARHVGLYLLALVLSALVLIANQHLAHIDAWSVFWAVVVLGLGVTLLRGGSLIGSHHSRGWQFGDVDVDPSQFTVRLHHAGAGRGRQWKGAGQLIGDIHLDLSRVVLPEGETPYDFSNLIGDITVLVPEGLAVHVEAETMVGDIHVFGDRAEGIGKHLRYESEGYAEAPVRARIMAQNMVGDITVRSV